MKLWGGNYPGDPDAAFWEFNRSFPFDRRLLAEEIAASKSWVRALGRCGAIPAEDAESLDRGLDVDQRIAGHVASLDAGEHFTTDEHGRNVNLTERGYEVLEDRLGCGSLIEADNLELLTQINCALHARVLLHRDVDYIVRDGRIELIDEFTGRVVADRHLPDGLQAAVERARERMMIPKRRMGVILPWYLFLKRTCRGRVPGRGRG